jgi:hypothetical protein
VSPRRKSKDSAEPRDTAKKLIELAADESTTTQERMSTAVKAVAIIRKYDLLSNPLDELSENETVKAARTIFSAFNDPAVKAAGNKIMDGIKGMRRR